MAKDKQAAMFLAYFGGFLTWLYTYKCDAWKFWLNVVLFICTAGIWFLGAMIWAIIDTLRRPPSFYANYPNGLPQDEQLMSIRNALSADIHKQMAYPAPRTSPVVTTAMSGITDVTPTPSIPQAIPVATPWMGRHIPTREVPKAVATSGTESSLNVRPKMQPGSSVASMICSILAIFLGLIFFTVLGFIFICPILMGAGNPVSQDEMSQLKKCSIAFTYSGPGQPDHTGGLIFGELLEVASVNKRNPRITKRDSGICLVLNDNRGHDWAINFDWYKERNCLLVESIECGGKKTEDPKAMFLILIHLVDTPPRK